MRVRWTTGARSDLREIRAYIARDSERYAAALVKRIRESAARLGRFPGLGAIVEQWNREDLKEIIVGNYRVVYQFMPREVWIVGVIHAARRLPDEPHL
jgi:plasmid stabilization system protein ParE